MVFWKKRLTEEEHPHRKAERPSGAAAAPGTLKAGESPSANPPVTAQQSSPAVDTPSGPPLQDDISEEGRILSNRLGRMRCAVANGTEIEGCMSFDMPVQIDGKLTGTLFSSSTVVVGPRGELAGDAEVASLIVRGVCTGAVSASEKVEVAAEGRMTAQVACPSLIIHEGGEFNGSSEMMRLLEQRLRLDSSVEGAEERGARAPETAVTTERFETPDPQPGRGSSMGFSLN